jgi:hypothetical protein
LLGRFVFDENPMPLTNEVLETFKIGGVIERSDKEFTKQIAPFLDVFHNLPADVYTETRVLLTILTIPLLTALTNVDQSLFLGKLYEIDRSFLYSQFALNYGATRKAKEKTLNIFDERYCSLANPYSLYCRTCPMYLHHTLVTAYCTNIGKVEHLYPAAFALPWLWRCVPEGLNGRDQQHNWGSKFTSPSLTSILAIRLRTAPIDCSPTVDDFVNNQPANGDLVALIHLALYTKGATTDPRPDAYNEIVTLCGTRSPIVRGPVELQSWFAATTQEKLMLLQEKLPALKLEGPLYEMFRFEAKHLYDTGVDTESVSSDGSLTQEQLDTIASAHFPDILPKPWATVLLFWLAQFAKPEQYDEFITTTVKDFMTHVFISERADISSYFVGTDRYFQYSYLVVETFTRWICIDPEICVLPDRRSGVESLEREEHKAVSVTDIWNKYRELTGISEEILAQPAFEGFFVDFCLLEAKTMVPLPEKLTCVPVDLAFFVLRTAAFCPRIWTEFAGGELETTVSWHGLERSVGHIQVQSEELLTIHDLRLTKSAQEVLEQLDLKQKRALEYFSILLGGPFDASDWPAALEEEGPSGRSPRAEINHSQ